MKKGDPEDAKLIFLPSRLVDRLKEVAEKHSVSLSSYTTEALEQTLRSEELGISLSDSVDMFRLMRVQQDSGAVYIPRYNLEYILRELYKDNEEELHRIWFEAGRWYGAYLMTKLNGEDMLDFLEKALHVSWNLDEVNINNDDVGVTIKYSSFHMDLESTVLLIDYISGSMHSFGYEEKDRDYLRGLAILRFKKRKNK